MSSRSWPRAPQAPCFWAPHRTRASPKASGCKIGTRTRCRQQRWHCSTMPRSQPTGTDKRRTGEAWWEVVFTQLNISASLRLAEHCVVLLGHPDERRPPAELFEFGSPYIGTGRPQSSEDIQNCVFHIPFVRHFHSLALRGPGGGRRGGGEGEEG